MRRGWQREKYIDHRCILYMVYGDHKSPFDPYAKERWAVVNEIQWCLMVTLYTGHIMIMTPWESIIVQLRQLLLSWIRFFFLFYFFSVKSNPEYCTYKWPLHSIIIDYTLKQHILIENCCPIDPLNRKDAHSFSHKCDHKWLKTRTNCCWLVMGKLYRSQTRHV